MLTWEIPSLAHNFPHKIRSLIFEEVRDDPQVQRNLILHSLKARQEETQESS